MPVPKKVPQPESKVDTWGASGACATSPFELAGGAKGEPGTCKGCLVPTTSGKGPLLCHYRNDKWAEEACQAEEGKVWCGAKSLLQETNETAAANVTAAALKTNETAAANATANAEDD